MTIQDAKEEIKRTVKAYHQRDENGKYKIPVEKQRPLFLMGPPGIGKTAIVEQVAEELKINLISYTITHHTRQSAIGLPFISRKKFGEKEYAVTEYTMSEIVASVYEQIERSGIQEGILFLDEINAVSETLSPTMLQFLQYKTFGMHRVPEGFVIVTAGNPAEFNKSVRDFDIATLDRLRQIDIEEDFQSFKDYAYQSSIHSAILSYLEIKKDRFYFVRQDIEGKHYVTARSWEDLSKMLYAYEELHYPIDKALCMEYLSDPELAEDFSLYYSLYQKYKEKYHVPEILRGNEVKDKRLFLEAPFDEKWSLLSLLNAALQEAFRTYAKEKSLHAMLFAFLKDVKVKNAEEQVGNKIEEEIRNERKRLSGWREARILSSEEEGLHLSYIRGLENFSRTLKEEGGVAAFSFLKAKFQKMEEERQERIDEAGKMLSNALRFLGETFGEGQEMILFLTELVKSRYALLFLSDIGNDTYNQYNQYLLLSLQEEAGKWIS